MAAPSTPNVGDQRKRTELAVSVVLAAWAIVLLCGYIAGAVPWGPA